MQPRLELHRLTKSFDAAVAVKGVDLAVAPGEFISLLGPSGCGKSTTLAMIAGFEQPDSGEVRVDGRVVNHLPPQRRRLGLVFQDYAVFSRLSVRRNLLFGLEAQGVARHEREKRVSEMSDKLGLGTLLNRRGAALNMSEMQRLAIARVLVTRPELLLLDEPMSNLDAAIRASLRTELKQIQTDLQQTVLYVTHDQAEAMAMSDRIAVMRAGEILQIGSPDVIYHRPATRFVAEFIGDPPMNILPCEVSRSGAGVAVRTALHGPLALGSVAAPPGRYLLGVRPHDVAVVAAGGEASAAALVRFVENLGAEHILHVQYGDDLLAVAAPRHVGREGQSVYLALRAETLHLISEDDGSIRRSALLEAVA
jgi:ABC-type sugar transport system ATPase subunit